MSYIEMTAIGASLGTRSSKLSVSGLNSHAIVPAGTVVDLTDKINSIVSGRFDSIQSQLNATNLEADNIKNNILALSQDFTSSYLKKSELTTDTLGTIVSSIVEDSGTFVTQSQAGQYYGLNLVTDVNGTKYVTGYSMGALIDPTTGVSDSYFRINADRFIVGGDLGDGFISGVQGELGEEYPVFSIIQEDGQVPELLFNGKVSISAVPQEITKFLGKFANIVALNAYLASHPEVIVNDGDSFFNEELNSNMFWNGTDWKYMVKAEKLNIVFTRSYTKPSTPVGGDFDAIPTGWSDGIPVGTIPIVWWSSAKVNTMDDYSIIPPVWSEPVVVSDTATTDYMFHSSLTTPPTPTYTGPLTEVSSTDSANGWYNIATTDSIWAAFRTKGGDGVWSAWGVYKVKGETGIAGTDGTDGTDGSRGSAILTGTATTASGYTSAFVTAFGNVLKGDQYISSTSSGTYIWTYSGSTWQNNTALQVHGDAVISGTLTADKLNSNALYGKLVQFDSTGALSSIYVSDSTWGSLSTAYSFTDTNRAIGLFSDKTNSGNGAAIYGRCTSGSQTGAAVVGNNLSSSSSSWGGFFRSVGGTGAAASTGAYSNAAIHGVGSGASCSLAYQYYGVYSSGQLYTSGAATIGSNLTVNSFINVTGNGTIGGNLTVTGKVTGGSFWVGTTQVAFTGGHIVISKSILNPGDIVSTINVIPLNISQTFPIVDLPSVNKDPKVIGIIATIENTEEAFKTMTMEAVLSTELIINDNQVTGTKDEIPEVTNTLDFISEDHKKVYDKVIGMNVNTYKTNSIGEGMINVCNINGNIDRGDYITSSVVFGKGMKQDDDILHSYTVAKSLEEVNWDKEIVGETCQELDGYKWKMIACTYHCG